jgi:hypothetical protein
MNIDFELTSVIERASSLLRNSQNNPQLLFYSALEIRYSIEILLDDWLHFVIQGSFSLSDYLKELYGDEIPEGSLDIPKDEKPIKEYEKTKEIYAAKTYRNKILEFVPKFKKRFEFMSLLEPSFSEMKIPDLAYLSKLYWKIGAYLHYYKQEIDIKKFHSYLEVSLKYIVSLNESSRCFIQLNKDGEKLFEKFEKNELSPSEIEDIKQNGTNYHNGGLYHLR